MANNVATLRARLVADTSQFTGAIKRARSSLGGLGKGFTLLGAATAPLKMLGGLLSKVAGGLLRIGQIAAGIILAAVFQKAVQAVMNFGKAVFKAVERMQTLRIQIGTLTARELSRSINKSIEQAVEWRGMTKEGEMLRINIDALRESVAGYEDVLKSANPALHALLSSQEKWGTVTAENAGAWISTSDAFAAAIPHTNAMMDQLARIAIISPFTLEATNNMFRMASAMGFAGDQALAITGGMLNVAAGLGLTNEQAQRLVLNFSQIRSQGKITQRDIREMSLTGFQMRDVFEEMNRTLGLSIETHEDFNKALKAGKFTWAEFTSSFESLADRQFGESARRMATTIQGIKSSLMDILTISADRIFGPAADAMGPIFDQMLDQFTVIVESGKLDEIGEVLRTKVAAGMTSFQESFELIQARGMGVYNSIVTILTGLEDAGVISEGWAMKLAGVHDKFFAIKGFINDITTGIGNAVRQGGMILGEGMDAAREGGQIDPELLNTPLAILAGGAADILAPLLVWWEDTFAPAVEGVIERLKGPVMDFVTNFVTGFTDTPIPGLLEAITGAIANIKPDTLQSVADAIVQIATFLADNAETIGRFVSTFLILAGLASAISTVAGAIGAIVAAIASAGGVMGVLSALLALIGGPITLAIAAVALALVAWKENWGGIQEKVGSVIDFLSGKFEDLKAKFEEIKDSMVAIWDEHLAPIWEAFMGVVEGVLTIIQDVVGVFTALRDIAIQIGTAFAEKFGPPVKEFVEDVLSKVKEKLQPIVDLFKDWWDIVSGKLAPVIEDLKDVLSGFIENQLKALKGGLDLVKGALDTVHGLFQTLKDALSNFELPWWLKPGSPPPLAFALMDIADGLEKAKKGMHGLKAGMSGANGFAQAAGDAALAIVGNGANKGAGQDPVAATLQAILATLKSQGDKDSRAQAMAEALQTADF